MHGLLQQMDTLNAAHAPEHLDMFEGLISAGKSAYNAGSDMYNGLVSEEQVIVYEFSLLTKEEQAKKMETLLKSDAIKTKYDQLLQEMVKSSTLKPQIMQSWYAAGIPNTLRKSVYDKMNRKK